MKKLILFLICLSLVAAVGFAEGQAESVGEPETREADLSQMESPALAAMVDAGELPPVDDRLPEEPLVVDPREAMGRYGGTLRPATNGQNQDLVSGQTPLIMYDAENTEFSPNLAKDYRVLDGGRVFEFDLRRGVKWSDGEPFTADDILFWWEVIQDTEFFPPGTPFYMKTTSGAGDVVKVNDYRVRFEFQEPNTIFLNAMATWYTRGVPATPKHYLSQFHPNYVDRSDLEELAGEEGYDSVGLLFTAKWDGDGRPVSNPEKPTLDPWMLVTPRPDDPMVFERNPYFWAVDSEGRQLPYIDRVEYNAAGDQQVLDLRIINGEVDWIRRTVAGNLPLYKENEESGDYTATLWSDVRNSAEVLTFNLSHPDEQMRSLFMNKDFRIAMSHAVNREEINELVYQGLAGDPTQTGPPPVSPYYNDQLSNQYLEYDPERAGEILDAIGMPVGSDGFRQYPNGDDLQITVIVASATENFEPVGELWVDYMRAVGIDANLRVIDRPAWHQINDANSEDFQATVAWGSTSLDPYLAGARHLVATQPATAQYAPAWATWHQTDGEAGVEPPAWMQRSQELFEDIQVTVDQEERIAISDQITGIAAENFFGIGTVEPPALPIIVSNRLVNVLDSGVFQWFSIAYVQQAYQWWIDE